VSTTPGGIAVVSAHNPLSYGMYSVDLAAEQFFGELGLPATHVVTQGPTRSGRMRFRLVRSPQELAAFGTVVYWGDFLNNPMWGERDYAGREVKRGWSATREAAWPQWCELYLDPWRLAPATRVFAIGGCFLGADGPAPAGTAERFARFIRSAELVAPRDGRSLETVRRLEPGGRLEEGMDCAWLLRHPPPPDRSGSRYFVCFLGRTLRGRDRGFLDALARRTGLRPVWLDWLNLDKPRFVADWRFRQMQRRIAGAAFVVTDTYHLVINALNRGVPAVCLHDGSQSAQDGTLGDCKKVALLEQLGLPGLLVDVTTPDDLAGRIAAAVEATAGPALEAPLAAFARRRADYVDLLRRALEAPPP